MSSQSPAATSGLLGRIVGGILALALGLVAVFVFTTFALVAVALALVGVVRLWWLRRSSPERPAPTVIDAEYTVTDDRESVREPDAILPPQARST